MLTRILFLFLVAAPISHATPLFFASEGTHAIDQISSTGVVSTYATFAGSSDLPTGLVLGRDGTLYVGNGGQGLLWKIPPGGSLQPFASTGNQKYSYGLALGGSGNIFAAISGLHVAEIDQITQAGTVSTFASLPAGSEPFGLVFDKTGNLFTSDAQLKKIYRITPGGAVSTFVNLPLSVSPTGLAFDQLGNLFVADFGGSIYRITEAGAVSTFASLSSGDGLKGLSFDPNGNLYVAAQNRNAVVRITPEGTVSDFAAMYAPQFFQVIPEPTTFGLLGLGTLLLAMRRRWS